MARSFCAFIIASLFFFGSAVIAEETQPQTPQAEETNSQTKAPASQAQEEAAQKPATISEKKESSRRRKLRGNAPCLTWIEPGVPLKAVLLCVHGLGLHNGTYQGFGQRMAKLGIATYAIDVRGFGSFMEAKGRETVDFEGCLDDVRSTLKVVRRAHPTLPVFILGESMGGAIALRSTAMFPDLVDGLISSVPAGDRFKQNKTRLNVALHFIADPNAPINIGTDVIKQATQKPELRALWANDPLARLKVSPNELIQFQRFMNQNHESAKLIKDKPVLFVQGCNDRLVRPEGTVELFNELKTEDRQIELIKNAEHLIFEEDQFTDKEIQIVNDWIAARIDKARASRTAVEPLKGSN